MATKLGVTNYFLHNYVSLGGLYGVRVRKHCALRVIDWMFAFSSHNQREKTFAHNSMRTFPGTVRKISEKIFHPSVCSQVLRIRSVFPAQKKMEK